MNTLKLQEPKESVNIDYFTTQKLISYLMEHFIWDRFYPELENHCINLNIELIKASVLLNSYCLSKHSKAVEVHPILIYEETLQKV